MDKIVNCSGDVAEMMQRYDALREKGFVTIERIRLHADIYTTRQRIEDVSAMRNQVITTPAEIKPIW